MARADIIKTNFTSGEVSPLILGRTDITKYMNGAEIIENFLVKPQGALFRRSGTRLINEVKEQSKFTKLVPFEFSDVQSYVLEFGDTYMRVYMNGGVVENPPGTPVEIVTPWATSDLPDLSYTQSADILFVCHPDYQTRKISRTGHSAWTIELYETTDGPYLPLNIEDIEMQISSVVDRETLISTTSDFAVGDVGDYVEYNKNGIPTLGEIIAYVSVTEVLIRPIENIVEPLDSEVTFVSLGGAPLVAVVTHGVFNRYIVGAYLRCDVGGSITWNLISGYDGASRTDVTVGASLTMVATTGILSTKDRTITAVMDCTENMFVSTDVDRQFRLDFTTDQVWGKVASYVSVTQVTVELDIAIPLKDADPTSYKDDGRTRSWRLGAWGETTGWPSCITFHEERLCFANTEEEPQTVWMSRSGDYSNHAPTEPNSDVSDDNGITYTIASNKVNSIKWLRSSQVLLIGTIGGEWEVKGSSASEPISPINISLSQQTSFGSLLSNPEKIGNSILHAQRSGDKVRQLSYSFEADSFVSSDMTIVSEHIIRDGGGITDMAFQQDPNNILWMSRVDGILVGFTYVKEQEVFAWHRHILGGLFGTSNAVVESIAAVSSAVGNVLYMVVKRTIDGSTARYIEYLEEDFYPVDEEDKDDMFFVDSGLSYSGVPAIILAGLDHLEGETVQVCADGAVIPDKIVSGGQIILDDAAGNVHAGLQFTSRMHTLPLEGGGNWGTSQAKIKRIKRLGLRILTSLGFKHGTEIANLEVESFRGESDLTDKSPPLFTGDKKIELDHDYDTLAQYWIYQDSPYPLNILALMPEFSTWSE